MAGAGLTTLLSVTPDPNISRVSIKGVLPLASVNISLGVSVKPPGPPGGKGLTERKEIFLGKPSIKVKIFLTLTF